MRGPENPPVIDKSSGRNRRGLGWAILKLYRGDTVWRGAVDLILIGSLIMLLVQGFPNLFSAFDRLFPSAAQKQAAATAPAAASPSANFSPGAGAPVTSSAAPAVTALPLPKPSAPNLALTTLSGTITPEDRKLLQDAIEMTQIDPLRAIDLLKDKAAKGDPNYQFCLGTAYVQNGVMTKSSENFAQAIYWYKEASAGNQPQAQFQLGQIYRLGAPGVTPQLEEAISWYERAAANPQDTIGLADNELGRFYQQGIFFPKDMSKAVARYEAGAKKGNPQAASNAGAIYFNGELGRKDIQKAIYWTKIGAEQGDAQAEMNLGRFYIWGTGQDRNIGEFLKWEGLAEEQGQIKAMLLLGDFFHEGAPDFAPDYTQAARHYRLAALKKDSVSQFKLAQMYENGQGMPVDVLQAYVYYDLSYKSGGYPPAYSSLLALRQRMQAGELEYAEKMSAALNPAGPPAVVVPAFAGIGVKLDFSPNHCYVRDIYPGTPAEKAGIRSGDEILQVDGQTTAGMESEKISALIRGPENTSVTLTVQSRGETKARQISVTRAMVVPK